MPIIAASLVAMSPADSFVLCSALCRQWRSLVPFNRGSKKIVDVRVRHIFERSGIS